MATASFEKLSVVNDSTHKHLIYISENNISNKTDCQKNMTDNAGVLITDPQILDRLKTSLSHPISISLILPTCLLEPTKYREQHSFAKCGVEDTSSANDGGKRQTTSLVTESVVGRLLSTLGHTFFCPPQSDGTNKRARNELKDSTDDVDTKSDSNIPLKRISVDHGMITTKDRPIITYEDDGNGECLEENGLQQGLFPIVADRPLDWSDSQEICAIQDFMDVQLTARLSATNSGTHGNLGLCSAPGKKVRLDVASAEAAALGSRAPVSRDLTLDFQRIVDHQFTAIINLLSDKELEFLGSPWPDYKRSAETAGLKVIRYPIVEGEGPADMDQFERQVMQPLLSKTQAGQNVICHCRGGVGRAGLVACCWLMRLGVCKGPVEAIAMVRVRRSPRAIETIVQEDFIRRYYGAYCTA